MKIGMVNKLTIMNRCALHTLQHNITHLAVITRKTNIKIDILKGGGKVEKSRKIGSFSFPIPTCNFLHVNFLTTLSDCYENL